MTIIGHEYDHSQVITLLLHDSCRDRHDQHHRNERNEEEAFLYQKRKKGGNDDILLAWTAFLRATTMATMATSRFRSPRSDGDDDGLTTSTWRLLTTLPWMGGEVVAGSAPLYEVSDQPQPDQGSS